MQTIKVITSMLLLLYFRFKQRIHSRHLLLQIILILLGTSSLVQAQTTLNSGATVNVSMAQGQAFSGNFAGTGTQDNVYTVVGVLPPGISTSTIPKPPPATSNHELVISGTPSAAGTYTVNVNVSATFFSAPITYTTTIVITVTPPPIPAPVASDSTHTVSKNSTSNNLIPTISGDFNSIAISSAPSHGTAVVSGSSIVYTPNTSYLGSDFLRYQAIGPGGSSAFVTMSINVTEATPVIETSSARVTANSTTALITPTISGGATVIDIATPPSRGVATVEGLAIRYVPEPGFYGVDRIAIRAIGPGGTSAPVTITINVEALAPVLSPASFEVVANSSANLIIPKTVGIATAINVNTPANHGTTIIRGTDILYTPNPGYVGDDVVTVSATGPGGVSNAVNLAIVVKPIAGASNNITVQANSANNVLPVLSLAGAVRLNLTTLPTQGTAAVQVLALNYTPKPNFVGSDSVTYAVIGSNGSFASATIQISVVAAAPVFKNASLTVETGRSGSIDLAGLISGPMFNGVTVRLNSPPAHGVASISGTVLTYSSTAGYIGLDSLQLTATAIGGTSNPAQLLITVVPRPDPSKDPGVIAMFAANTAAVRHFEQTQIEHFNGRMLSLASQSANGNSTAGQNSVTECGPISYWVSGLNSAGRYRTVNGLKYSTFGLSAGGDRCFAGGQTHIGFGLGYARDHSESEQDLSFMKANANTAVSYLTTQLLPSMRFSFMIGVNQIQDRFARFDVHDQALAYGEWKGTQMISSGALSSDLSFDKVLLIPYMRLDLTKLQLDPFSESGSGTYLLHYHKQTMQSQRSTLGFNSEMKLATSWGELIPRLKLELQRDFARRDSLKINYIDLPDAVYLVPSNDLDRRVVLVSLGADMIWKNGMMTIFNFSHTNANANNKSNRFNVRFSYQY